MSDGVDARPPRPGTADVDAQRAFWADAVADQIEARDPQEPVVIKGGISPSGVPHLGNMNEVLRGYFVAEALRDRGREVRQVFTTDDFDPLRSVPRKLADLDGNVVDLGEVDAGALGRNLGRAYTDVPDPFGCCDSYGDHFSTLIETGAERLGVPVETVSNTALYERGEFEPVVRSLLMNREAAHKVIADHQASVDDDYVPFRPRCAECGLITGTDAVTGVDLDAGVVHYECGDIEAGEQVIEGCGHRGTATIREGKLPWRFEWPAQWRVLDVDHEPFGKDHAEGSWPSGVEIARDLLDLEPPVPMVYEWFTLNGEPFSSSAGHVVTVQEVLDLVEPEVVRYFFTLDPGRTRDFSIPDLGELATDFDRFERRYFGEESEGGDEGERARAERAYPAVARPTVAARFEDDGTPSEDPAATVVVPPDSRAAVDAVLDGAFADRVRLPYTFAAVLGMTDDPELREEMARNEGHLPEGAPEWAVRFALARVPKARHWAERVDNEYNYRIQADLPDVPVDDRTARALDELADFVAAGHDGEAVQGEIYETAKRHDIAVGDLFATGYRLFFDQPSGPKLGPLLGALDREFVVRRLRREG
ncbi:MAG: lysine--tRNA ligase [Halobacteriaceae archaeon]